MTSTAIPIPEAVPTSTPRRANGRRHAGIALAVLAAAATIGGGGMLAVDRSERDDDGYFTSDTIAVTSSGYAVASDPLDIGDLNGGGEKFVVDHLLGKVRVEATSTTGKPVLVGIAPRKDLDRYLAGVASTRVTDVGDHGRALQRDVSGGAPAGPASAQDFWEVSATGSGRQILDWKVEEGDWAIAVLNADGSTGVAADVELGADTNVLRWLGFGLLAAGMTAFAGAFVVLRRAPSRR